MLLMGSASQARTKFGFHHNEYVHSSRLYQHTSTLQLTGLYRINVISIRVFSSRCEVIRYFFTQFRLRGVKRELLDIVSCHPQNDSPIAALNPCAIVTYAYNPAGFILSFIDACQYYVRYSYKSYQISRYTKPRIYPHFRSYS